jgi:leader peptidase (prepilin peptidase)/N-methyltransferase
MASVIGAVVGIGMKLGNALREGATCPSALPGRRLVVMLAGLDRVLGWIGQ